MAAARKVGPPIVTGKLSTAESETDACEVCAGGEGAGADIGSASAGGGTRLGSVPVMSAEPCACRCGASADGGAVIGTAAVVDAGTGDPAGPVGVGAKSGETVIAAGASA